MNNLQRKFYLNLIVGLIILIVFIWIAVCPLFIKIRELSKEYLSNQKLLLKLEQRETLAKNLEEEYQERGGELSDIRKAFIGATETVGFIYSLEKVAKETNNAFEIKTVSPFNPSDQVNQDEMSFIGFRISLWGDYPSLLSFISSLESVPYPPYRLIELESINIKRLTDVSTLLEIAPNLKQGDIETILNIKIYTR